MGERREHRDWSESEVTTEHDGTDEAVARMIEEHQRKKTKWDPNQPDQAVFPSIEVPDDVEKKVEPAPVRRRRVRNRPKHQVDSLFPTP